MANDGSLASKVEDWIVTQLLAVAQFAAGTVEPFLGTTQPDGRQLIDEMTAKRSPYAVVLFEGDHAVVTQEGKQDYEPTYAIYVTVQNERQGAARNGDGTTPGTNLLRDLLRNALHDKIPAQSANGFWAERAEFRGTQIVFQRSDAFVMRAELVVREVPAA